MEVAIIKCVWKLAQGSHFQSICQPEYVSLAVCEICCELYLYITRVLLRASAVLRAELSNKQKAQTFDKGSTNGKGSTTYWLCQELRQGKALQKRERDRERKEVLLMMVSNLYVGIRDDHIRDLIELQ